jgi:leucine-zipper of insertion element IS481
MKLHRNAALSLKGRRELCRRVVEGKRTSSEAAAAAEVSVAEHEKSWRSTTSAEGARDHLRRQLGRIRMILSSNSTPRCISGLAAPHRSA